MAHTAETQYGYEPPLAEILNSGITQMVMDSDKVARSHVEEITRRTAKELRTKRGL